MRVNSISNLQYINKSMPTFKHTAIPYPEFAKGYLESDKSVSDKIANLINKLFNKDLTEKSENIKSQIDAIYDTAASKSKNAVSVLA